MNKPSDARPTAMSRRLSRPRKLLFAVAAVLLFFVGLEGAARLYSRLHYGNPVSLNYGINFVQRLIAGGVSLDQGWGSGRGSLVGSTREANAGADAEALFARRDDPNDGLVLREPQRVVNFNGGHSATLNRFGYRGREIVRDAPSGTYRVAVFGGSYVFGAYLRDEQTWASLLEAGLRTRGAAVEVINAGVSGSNIHGVLTDVIHLTNHVSIDAAVITSGYNNHPLLPIERKYTALRRLDFYLYNGSLFYVMFKERLAKLAGEPLDYGLYGQPVKVNQDDVEWLVALYKKRLDQIAQVCAERHIRVIYASEAERFFRADLNARSSQSPAAIGSLEAALSRNGQLTIAELEAYLQGRLNRAAHEIADAHHAPFFDGEEALLADKEHTFVDQIHPNEIGAARLAAGLIETVWPLANAAAGAVQ